jgi:hypothetical protein
MSFPPSVGPQGALPQECRAAMLITTAASARIAAKSCSIFRPAQKHLSRASVRSEAVRAPACQARGVFRGVFVPILFSDAATVMAAIVRPVTQQTLAGDRRRHGRMVRLAAVASVIDSPLIAAHGEAVSAAAPAGNASCAPRTSRAHARKGVWGDGERAPSAE